MGKRELKDKIDKSTKTIRDKKHNQVKTKANPKPKVKFTRNISNKERLYLIKKRKYFKKSTSNNVSKAKSDRQEIEEQIELIENENELFDTAGYYKVPKQDHINEKDWEPIINTSSLNLNEIIFNEMNKVKETNLDPRIKEAYTLVADILKKYTSGKLPKAFNILPSLENWEEIIEITNTKEWSPNAYYEATIMFTSNLNSSLSETFYRKYLLPVIRHDIKTNNTLNIHFYKCLKKALFKPAAFFKGIILPIAFSLTAKEATIIGSILKKCSIPVAHSSSALMKLSENSIISNGHFYFINILLSKKYALPNTLKDNLIRYFCGFSKYWNEQNKLPVLYHQALLSFCQIYKYDLNETDKQNLKNLLMQHNHHIITDLVLKELNFKLNIYN